jgi:hypothetical protein
MLDLLREAAHAVELARGRDNAYLSSGIASAMPRKLAFCIPLRSNDRGGVVGSNHDTSAIRVGTLRLQAVGIQPFVSDIAPTAVKQDRYASGSGR